ncbi:anthranilate synthase component I [Zavarzinella formosa]|uniref:anthranilate synthase component I n=1 Tax=Zavarzinella formosa TaxID=360055 RepID=UPI0003734E30|nr:anthranilate synthase component I [Zavarzinella formosa]
MRYYPSFEEFCQLATGATVVPVYRRLLNDSLTPVHVFWQFQHEKWAFLFESVVGGERHGRYSFVGGKPFQHIEAYDRHVILTTAKGDRHEFDTPDPLRKLEEILTAYHAPHVPGLPRFCGGAVGYAGYDTVRYVERLPNAPEDDRGLPDLSFALYDEMVVFDHANKTLMAVAHANIDHHNLKRCYADTCARVDRMVEKLLEPAAPVQLQDIELRGPITVPHQSNFTPDAFKAAVVKCKEYINAGDIFQVVLSQRFQTKTTANAFDIYRALRAVNPSPFMFFVKTPSCTLVGASPEIMTRVENNEVTIRPLAGTRKRGATPEEDKALAEELLADPKERAEHIMLVDLGRNDVGRVAKFGSVRISELLTVERYSHVMHISSTVTGELDAGKTTFDALRSCLPAGTLSGAPKIRAMEIIDELEPHRRGPYGGAVGYVDFTGNMDTCIALRTMVIQGDTAYIQAGAGLVADSDPEAEYQETVNKAMGLMRALEIAETQLK